jgi:P-type Mg2+ transporter
MVLFGLISSAFDYLSFGVLWLLVGAVPELFRAGWFVLSVLTELIILLVVRTRGPIYRSGPASALWISMLAVAGLTLILPVLPFHELLGFAPLPLLVIMVLLIITVLYAIVSEMAKLVFYRRLRL